MTNNMTKKTIRELLCDHALEFILEAPDEEFLAFVHDSGSTPEALSEMVKLAGQAAIKTHGKKKLVAARNKHTENVAKLADMKASEPGTLEEKVAILAQLVARQMSSGLPVSLQHRNLKSLTEKELDEIILQLQTLEAQQNPEKE